MGVEVNDNSGEVIRALKGGIEKALEAVGMKAEGYAKDGCPVDTGNLRNSITHATDKTAAYIGTNVEYAAHVELGTSKKKPKPFLVPAAKDHADQYVRIFKNYIGNA